MSSSWTIQEQATGWIWPTVCTGTPVLCKELEEESTDDSTLQKLILNIKNNIYEASPICFNYTKNFLNAV